MKKNAIKNLTVLFILTAVIFFSCKENAVIPPEQEYCDYQGTVIDISPAWSPDGNTIAFVSGDSFDDTGIYLIDTNGDNRRYFLNVPLIMEVNWSPDSKWLLISNAGQLFKISIDGNQITRLTFDEYKYTHANWSPDGNFLLCTRSYPDSLEGSGIWIMDTEGNLIKKIPFPGGFPKWNNNSHEILYKSNYSNNSAAGDSLYTVNINTFHRTFLYSFKDENYRIIYYPKRASNNKIIFMSFSPYLCSKIWSFNLINSEIKILTENIETGHIFDISPDGELIVFANCNRNIGRLWIMKIDGSGKRQLTF